ncbi:unnamed protein product [Lactuca saligna]|uniref:Uncharacterized protein n=1 Tax=Lactuca saligna TaxID=75948 RepID=A0AA35Y0F4_LACSI|nr:unnamed protein product [Lactuca saligna]
MIQPTTSLFSSQLTVSEKSVLEENPGEDDVMVSFVDIEFDPKEDNIPDHMPMIEVDMMLKSQDHRLRLVMTNMERQQEDLLKLHANNFEYEIKKLHYVAKERKLDVVIEAIWKLVENFTSFSNKDLQVLTKTDKFLARLKESISKLDSSPKSSISQESLSKIFSSLESNMKSELAHLLKIVNLMPTNAPHVKTRVQGGEKGVGSSKDLS